MGFALWIDGEVAWAQGTHEYRPMGTAVVAVTDTFRARDFHPGRRSPGRLDPRFSGFFASLGEMNAHLRRWRSASRRKASGALPWIPF